MAIRSDSSEEIIVTSASSKTALAFAYLLKNNHPNINLTGITSRKNVDFCSELGIYNNIYNYDNLDDINASKCSIVDFTGNTDLLIQLQSKVLQELKKCISVGLSHWDNRSLNNGLPLKSELFFAPTHARAKQSEWGSKRFKIRLNQSISDFIKWADNWMIINKIGIKGIIPIYHQVVSGMIDPKEGLILKFK